MSTLKEISVGRSDVFMIPPDALKVHDGWNSREASDPDNQAHIESLATSIAEGGVKVPLVVYFEDDEIWVADGHCRLAATRLAMSRGAEIKAIPVKTEGRGASEADRLLLQILDSKPKTPLERGRVVKRLLDFGWSEAEVAAKSGFSRQYIADVLNLNAAPKDVRELVEDGSVSSTLAIQVLKEDGARAGTVLREAKTGAAARGKTRATAKDLRQVDRGGGKKASDGMPTSLKSAALDVFAALQALTEAVESAGDAVPEACRVRIPAARAAIARAMGKFP